MSVTMYREAGAPRRIFSPHRQAWTRPVFGPKVQKAERAQEQASTRKCSQKNRVFLGSIDNGKIEVATATMQTLC